MATRSGRPDLTTGPIGPTLLAFALPTLGSNILQTLNGSINAIWVGRFLGEGALAATSNANNIMFLTFGAVFGFGMASTILIGQSWGRRDVEGARRVFGSAIGLVVGAAVVVGALGWVFAPEILRALATPPAALPQAEAYLRVIFPRSARVDDLRADLHGAARHGRLFDALVVHGAERAARRRAQPAADRRHRAVSRGSASQAAPPRR